jgi:redox-sensitive bicupin YhaK (pirin superfamily)
VDIVRAEQRGGADHGWLKTRHSFSFARYYDPARMGFRALRVLNEDRVAPAGGFPSHAHRDMEILSVVLDGALEHRDSTGGVGVLRPGEVQRMTAGRGVVHSEYNPSRTESLHFLQIWLKPHTLGLEPGYEQKRLDPRAQPGELLVVASPDARAGSLRVQTDAVVLATVLRPGDEVSHALAPGRGAYVHAVEGDVVVAGEDLEAGDAVQLEASGPLTLTTRDGGMALVFDLA